MIGYLLKVEAACRFATQSGKLAAIGALADAPAILSGKAGTRIVAEPLRSPTKSRMLAHAVRAARP